MVGTEYSFYTMAYRASIVAQQLSCSLLRWHPRKYQLPNSLLLYLEWQRKNSPVLRPLPPTLATQLESQASGPVLAVLAFWGTNQEMEDLLSLPFSVTLPFE